MTQVIRHQSREIMLAVLISVVLFTILILTILATWHLLGSSMHIWPAVAARATVGF
jgi:hypothetical protein